VVKKFDNKMSYFKFIFLILIFSVSVYAQNGLHIPLEYQKAFSKNTRSMDGNPGANYWQNHSDYKINAEFFTATRTLKGTESIIYYNESPDTLKNLVVRLYQNINRPESSKDWDYDPRSFTDGVKINQIKIDGEEIDIEKTTEHSATNLQINKTLNPKSQIELYFDWSFDLPDAQSPRMGKYDTATYMIAYWYPQMAVYDDIDGWDRVDYRGQVEYYNDFSNFDVTLSVDNPNCMVWATGELQNPDEVFSEKFSSAFKSKEEDKVFNFITNENRSNALLKKDKLIWHYKADYVPDFAFSFSDKYIWDFINYKAEPNRTVRISAAYNPGSKGFEKVCKIAYDAIKYFSTEFPGVPFPYPSMTVFNGAGGMEFPMMVNDTKTDAYSSDIYLTSHEISHTYFPFYMGTNERKYAWMDEGWAVIVPQDFQTVNSDNVDSRERIVKSYTNFAGTSYDVPLMMLSHQLKSPSYRIASYQKAAMTYNILKDILGKEMFEKCTKEYIKRWHGKHPVPYDFFNTFENVSGQNLGWFFKPWYFEFGYPDLSIVSASEENGEWKVVIENKGNYPAPICLNFETAEGNNFEYWESANVWSKGNKTVTIKKEIKNKIILIKLGSKYIPDINTNDNTLNINK